MDAKNGEKRSSDGVDDQAPESPLSLIEVLVRLAIAMDQQNSLLMELINQNTVLIGNLADDEQPENQAFDMAGNRIQVT